MMDILSI